MLRTSGLSKEKVKQAKETLLAKQQYPSVDAVRIELGNTGSKTTIHKYLKELENESTSTNAPTLSESLQNFVAQLAQQLHLEADQRITQNKNELIEKETLWNEALSNMQQKNDLLHNQVQDLLQQLEKLNLNLHTTKEELNDEKILRHKNQQYVDDLQQQLLQSKSHHQALLEKFNHTQQSLEHYRESVKEQRQQDLRRHDNAIQHLQNEIKQLQQTIVIEKKNNTQIAQDYIKANMQITQMTLKDEQTQKYITQLKEEQLIQQQHQEKLLINFQVEKAQHQSKEDELQQLKQKLNYMEQKLQQQHDYDDLVKHNLMLKTEINVHQKMYDELLHSIRIQPISQVKK